MELRKTPKEFYLYNCVHITFPYPGLQEQVNDPKGIMAQSFLVTHFKHSSTVVYLKKKALTGAVSLACLEIRSRNEETVNSARNAIYSPKVFYFLPYRLR